MIRPVMQRGSTLIIYLIWATAILGAIYGLYYLVDHRWATTAGIELGRSEVQAKWDDAVEKQRALDAKKIADADTKKGTADAKAKVVYRTITETVDRYIDRPVYRNACFDDDGLRDANRALLGQIAPAGKPDGSVPKPKPAQ